MTDMLFVIIYLFAAYGAFSLGSYLANLIYDQYEKRPRVQVRKEIARLERMIQGRN